MQTRRVTSDADRERIRSFFDLTLPDRTGLRVPPREIDRISTIPSVLRIVEDDGEIVAAVFASNDPEDVGYWLNEGEVDVASVIADEIMMVHQIAVVPALRRTGVGTELIRRVIDDGLGTEVTIVIAAFNDNQRGLADFYERLDFDLTERGEALFIETLALPGVTLRFPQNDKRYRWAFRVLRPARARVVAP